ncbi:hypothetical protein [Paenibacillus sp. DCT19]|uniref:hypothetical protein n=1 Tax=Paenibacillus sp. DCT19 TaxID=2211212 RepID=UPI000FE1CAA9|nr:hypothetical protein [Paenibacillus sp. DCT19]
MDGSPHVSFSKPTKPLPQNSRQQNFWKETEAGKGDLARKLDGGMGEAAPIKPIEPRGEPIEFEPIVSQEKIAQKTYDRLRETGLNMNEIKIFSQNTGLNLDEAIQLKKHLILTKHVNLPDTVTGKYYYTAYFNPDMHIGYGWEKALKGELAPDEKIWFRQLADHELAESKMMQDGIPYRKIESWNVKEGLLEGRPIRRHMNLLLHLPKIFRISSLMKHYCRITSLFIRRRMSN